jgi:hypothetical protein
MEAFKTGIDARDCNACIVCGIRLVLEQYHIVPKVEVDTAGL